MMLDLGMEEMQREPRKGPVPAGSRVLVRLSLERPKFPTQEDPFVAEGKTGLRYLSFKAEVVAGSYEGCWWYERITLPAAAQRIALSEGQKMACRIGGSMLRAVVESAEGVSPKDTSPQAARARQINGWMDLDGKTFPARLGLEEGGVSHDGNTYWNNRISAVVPTTSREWSAIKAGGEIITDGPVSGESRKAPPQDSGGYGYGHDNRGGYGSPPPPPAYGSEHGASMDDVPF